MARLQDFQSVTPNTANDNLLIVQSAGQGNAKIDVVGQKIASDTTHSGLTTTSKKLVGAINELKTRVDGKENTVTWDTKPTAGHGSGYAVTSAGLAKLNDCITMSAKSGAIASFSTDVADRLYSCKAAINAWQGGSGTPSPTNVRPIYGFSAINVQDSGKNLLDLRKQTDGTLNGEALSVSGSGNYFAAHVVFPLKANKKYIFTARVTRCDNSARIAFRDLFGVTNFANSSLITTTGDLSVTYTPTEDMIVRLAFFSTFGSQAPTAVTIYDNCQVEIANSATAYEAYNGMTGSASLGQTIYGGTADLVNGNGIKTWGYVDLGSLDYTDAGSGKMFSNKNIKDLVKLPSTANELFTWQINTIGLTAQSYNSITTSTPYGIALSINGTLLLTLDTSATYTASTFKAALNGVYLVYELATPETFTFTGANVYSKSGLNNAFADCGNIDLKYLETIGNKFNS